MSNRKQVTQMLSDALERYLDPYNDPRIYWAREVTFDYATAHTVRVDYMRFVPLNNSVSGIEKGDFYCYEIKSSVEDFKSQNGHNMLGDLNYYVMPNDVFEAVKGRIPAAVGVLCPSGDGSLKTVKKGFRQNRLKSVTEMLLMMWRSSRREVVKTRRDPITRCEDCRFSEWQAWADRYSCGKVRELLVSGDHFCRWGEKKQQETERKCNYGEKRF